MGLRHKVRIGFHEFERNIEQALKVDLALQTDFSLGPARDQHQGLVDYYVLTQRLQAFVQDRVYDLIEALAVDLARESLKLFPGVTVRVKVHKLPLDMPMVDGVAVEVVRSAADFGAEG
jgi:dihydroneopterin aldolase